mmetsp:Transcript_28847/g.42724  ORF Transcript_28847/g.42724 Transcript_28847/m.42724 type:complete len:103 (-) Transcript_28847:289-597(-)
MSYSPSTDASVTFGIHKLPQSRNHPLGLLRQLPRRTQYQNLRIGAAAAMLLIQNLKGGNAEYGGFAGAALGLSYHVTALDDWADGTLLYGTGAFEPVREYSS